MSNNGHNNINGDYTKNMIGDYNHFNDNSQTYINIVNNIYKCNPSNSLNNSNNRTMLKNMVGKQIQIWAYAVSAYETVYDKMFKCEVVRYTIINIHNKNNYIADHIQLTIPLDMYDPEIENKIIMVDGLVYSYPNNKNKQSIKATKINISFANDLEIHKDFKKIGRNLTDTEAYKVYNKLRNYTPDVKFNLLLKYMDILNNLLLRMPRDFISNYIVNHFTININPNAINRADYSSLINDENSIIMILYIIVSLIKGLSTGGISSVNMLFTYINWILNSMHGFNEDDIIINRSNEKEDFVSVNCVPTREYPEEFKVFCTNRNLTVHQAYQYIKTRNSNFDGRVLDKHNACKSALEILYIDLFETRDLFNF